MRDRRHNLLHPMQPIGMDSRGVARFKANAVVEWMLETAMEAKLFDLNTIGRRGFDIDELEHLMQLIGYSASGYSSLGFVTEESAREADLAAAAVIKEFNDEGESDR